MVEADFRDEQKRRFELVACTLTPWNQYELLWDCDDWLGKAQTRDVEYMREMLG